MTERVIMASKESEKKHTCTNSYKQNPKFNSSESSADRILQFQRTAGNQAVQSLIKSGTVQAKLRLGQPNDIYEWEADRVAENVMGISDSILPCKFAGCNRNKEKILQAKNLSGQLSYEEQDLPPIIQQILHSPGRPLDNKTRAFMEPRFGYDFSGIRVHTDTKAAKAAKVLDARAFTVGKSLVFGDGEYEPGTENGQKLMAHELTHVVQQNKGTISKSKEVSPDPNPLSAYFFNFQPQNLAPQSGSRQITGDIKPAVYSNMLQKAERLGSKVTHPKGVKRPYKKVTATFDGKDFVLLGDGKVILNAPSQSGRPYKVRAPDAKACHGSSEDSYLNNPRYVGIADNGPIPEGEFTFMLTDMVMFTTLEQMKMSLAGESEYIDPSGSSLHGDWGAGRAPLRPIRVLPAKTCGNTRVRSGFYLHGGSMPGSSGCIDIGNDAIKKVSEALKGYSDPVHLIVKYTQPPPEAGPLSRAAGRFMYPPGKNPSLMDRLKSLMGD